MYVRACSFENILNPLTAERGGRVHFCQFSVYYHFALGARNVRRLLQKGVKSDFLKRQLWRSKITVVLQKVFIYLVILVFHRVWKIVKRGHCLFFAVSDFFRTECNSFSHKTNSSQTITCWNSEYLHKDRTVSVEKMYGNYYIDY